MEIATLAIFAALAELVMQSVLPDAMTTMTVVQARFAAAIPA